MEPQYGIKEILPMATEKKDLLEKCNQTNMPVKKHVEAKCSNCRKSDCVRAAKAS